MQQPQTFADGRRKYVAGNAEHPRVAGIGRRQPRHGIENARPRHDKADTDLPAGARITVGHVGGRLLVARADKRDPVGNLAQPSIAQSS